MLEESKQLESFGAACKQMAKPVWSRLNCSNELPTIAEHEAVLNVSSRLAQKDGPFDTSFFAHFMTLLEDTISEVKGEQMSSLESTNLLSLGSSTASFE